MGRSGKNITLSKGEIRLLREAAEALDCVDTDGPRDPWTFPEMLRVSRALRHLAERARAANRKRMRESAARGKDFVWTAEVAISKRWVEDGFDLTPARLSGLILREVPAHGSEVEVRILKAPSTKRIRKVQGFK